MGVLFWPIAGRTGEGVRGNETAPVLTGPNGGSSAALVALDLEVQVDRAADGPGRHARLAFKARTRNRD